MSDSVVFSRARLPEAGRASASPATAAGCAKPPAEKLIPYLIAPEDILPGVPYWYASTCRECPAGCGTLVKAREGRAIKIEGNPAHPVNARRPVRARPGGAAGPLRSRSHRDADGEARTARGRRSTWDEALTLAGDKIAAARASTASRSLTGHETGSLRTLAGEWARRAGGKHVDVRAVRATRACARRTAARSAWPRCRTSTSRARTRCVIASAPTSSRPGSRRSARRAALPRCARSATDSGASSRSSRASRSPARTPTSGWRSSPAARWRVALAMAHVILAEGLGPRGAERAALLEARSPRARPKRSSSRPTCRPTTITAAGAALRRSAPEPRGGGRHRQPERAVRSR